LAIIVSFSHDYSGEGIDSGKILGLPIVYVNIDFAPDGRLYATVNSPGVANDMLATIDVASGKATMVNPSVNLGHDNVFALVFVGERLYSLTAGAGGSSGLLLEINRVDGSSRFVRYLSFRTFGGT